MATARALGQDPAPSARPVAPVPPEETTPSAARKSLRGRLGTLELSPAYTDHGPILSEDLRLSTGSTPSNIRTMEDPDTRSPSLAVSCLADAISANPFERRALSMDSAADLTKKQLKLPELLSPSAAAETIRWGVVYDDDFSSEVSSPTTAGSLTQREGLEGLSEVTDRNTIRPGSFYSLGPISENFVSGAVMASIPPSSDKALSFKRRLSKSSFPRQTSGEIVTGANTSAAEASDPAPPVTRFRSIFDIKIDSDSDDDDVILRSSGRVEQEAPEHTDTRSTMSEASPRVSEVSAVEAPSDRTVNVEIMTQHRVDSIKIDLPSAPSSEKKTSGHVVVRRRAISEDVIDRGSSEPVKRSLTLSCRKKSTPSVSTITNAYVLQHHRHLLTDYEVTEILDFRNVYFFGHGSAKVSEADAQEHADGFDDSSGNLICPAGSHVAYRFEVIEAIGKGSFGAVHKCMDHKHCQYTAVKIVKNRKRFHKQVANEIKILSMIKEHVDFPRSNCIMLRDYFQFRKHICLCFPLMGRSLFDYMVANSFKSNSLAFVQRIAVQLVDCLVFLYGMDIIHCDLKPENILLVNEAEAEIRVIDFGSSCLSTEILYQYIQSRYYRSPEVLLGTGYDKSIDIWSLGCILPEIRYGSALFTGCSEADQLSAIAEVIGPADPELLAKAKKTQFIDSSNGSLHYTTKKNGKPRKVFSRRLEKILPRRSDVLFRDFVSKCLTWSPSVRINPMAARQHPWIKMDLNSNTSSSP